MSHKILLEVISGVAALGAGGLIIRIVKGIYDDLNNKVDKNEIAHLASKKDLEHLEETYQKDIENISDKLSNLDNKLDRIAEYKLKKEDSQ